MAENQKNVPVSGSETKPSTSTTTPQTWHPFDSLRREVDRLFEDFGSGLFGTSRRSVFDLEPFWQRGWPAKFAPAVDIVEKEKAYEVVADLPGMEQKNIEVKVANGTLTIRGEQREEKEEKQKDYYLQERRVGSFERSFRVPDNVEADKIEAQFANGVLTVTLPKAATAQAKTVEIKGG